MTIQQAAQATLDRLREKGWSSNGPYGEHGEECINVAALRAIPRRELPRLHVEVAARMPKKFLHHVYDSIFVRHDIADWNDSNDTYWEDIERVLEEIATS